MPRIDIHTTLGFCPRPKKHEILVITRGATASITYDLFSKPYSLDNIDQFTYLFKQGKNLWAYEMIEYFCITEDTAVKADKNYYERRPANISDKSMYIFTKQDLPAGTAIPTDTLYEEHELLDGETTDNWQFNSHYAFFKGDEYSYISFILSAEETKQFKPTAPDCNVQCEVAIRLNTDPYSGMHDKDAIIAEAQHPIAVIDSLYSNISKATEGSSTVHPVAGDNLPCGDNLYCND